MDYWCETLAPPLALHESRHANSEFHPIARITPGHGAGEPGPTLLIEAHATTRDVHHYERSSTNGLTLRRKARRKPFEIGKTCMTLLRRTGKSHSERWMTSRRPCRSSASARNITGKMHRLHPIALRLAKRTKLNVAPIKGPHTLSTTGMLRINLMPLDPLNNQGSRRSRVTVPRPTPGLRRYILHRSRLRSGHHPGSPSFQPPDRQWSLLTSYERQRGGGRKDNRPLER